MNLKRKIVFISLIIVLPFLLNCANKSKYMTINASASIPKTGMTIDASYDYKLDGVVPGYKILNVAIENSSLNIARLDSIKDAWWLIDRKGSKKKAIIDLRREDPDVWEKMPDRLKKLLVYPLILPTGGTINIDLLFPKTVNLSSFRAVIFHSFFFNQTYKIVIKAD